jgi:hypothetical protein
LTSVVGRLRLGEGDDEIDRPLRIFFGVGELEPDSVDPFLLFVGVSEFLLHVRGRVGERQFVRQFAGISGRLRVNKFAFRVEHRHSVFRRQADGVTDVIRA